MVPPMCTLLSINTPRKYPQIHHSTNPPQSILDTHPPHKASPKLLGAIPRFRGFSPITIPNIHLTRMRSGITAIFKRSRIFIVGIYTREFATVDGRGSFDVDIVIELA